LAVLALSAHHRRPLDAYNSVRGAAVDEPATRTRESYPCAVGCAGVPAGAHTNHYPMALPGSRSC